MKKMLSTIFALSVIIMVFATTGFSQSLTLKWNIPNMENGSGAPLSNFSAIMVVMQPFETPVPEPIAGNMDTPYFLTGNDQIMPLTGMFAGFNPVPYNVVFDSGLTNIALDLSGFSEGDTFKMYVRVFDNISYDKFGAGGIWNGTFADGTTLATGGTTNYYQSASQIVTVNIDPSNEVIFVLSTPGETMQMMLPDGGQLPAGEPIPEPSAMLLAAVGLAWLGRKVKKI